MQNGAKDRIKKQVKRCINDLRKDQLTEARLQGISELLEEDSPKFQSLLYLQTEGTGVIKSRIIGYNVINDRRPIEVPSDPEQWPYQTVLDAMKDGWRIIKFPGKSWMINNEHTYGLGCEYILEKWE